MKAVKQIRYIQRGCSTGENQHFFLIGVQGILLQGFITRREALGLFGGFPPALSSSKSKEYIWERTEGRTEFIRVKVADCCWNRIDSNTPVLCLLREESDDCVHLKSSASRSLPEGK